MQDFNENNRKQMEKINFQVNISPSIFRSRRDELISRLTDGINFKRLGTKYKPVTTRQIAIRCNMNPFLKSDSELNYEIEECERKETYAHFFWITK